MRAHHKLTSQERDKIAYGYAVGESLREMARRLGRSPSSIFEEIKRNTVDGRYHSIRAHQASEARRQNSHKKYVTAHLVGLTTPNGRMISCVSSELRAMCGCFYRIARKTDVL